MKDKSAPRGWSAAKLQYLLLPITAISMIFVMLIPVPGAADKLTFAFAPVEAHE